MTTAPIILKENQTKSFPVLEAGAYRASCYGIVVLGTQHNDYYNKEQTKIAFFFELPDERIEINGEDLPRGLSVSYTLSLNEKAGLRKMLEGWRGKPFTVEELQGFDVSRILGAPCLVTTIVGEKQNGDQFAKINSIAKLPKMMAKPEQVENELVLFDITNEAFPLSDMEKLPKWVQDEIMKSNEYLARKAEAETVYASAEDFTEVECDGDLPF